MWGDQDRADRFVADNEGWIALPADDPAVPPMRPGLGDYD